MKHHHPNTLHDQLYFILKTWLLSPCSSVNTCKILRCVSHICYLSSLLFSHFCSLLHFFIYNKERNAVIVLFLPKPPLENIGHLKVNSHGKACHDWPGKIRVTRKAWATALHLPSAIRLQCFPKRATDSYSPLGFTVWVWCQPIQIFGKSKGEQKYISSSLYFEGQSFQLEKKEGWRSYFEKVNRPGFWVIKYFLFDNVCLLVSIIRTFGLKNILKYSPRHILNNQRDTSQ